MAQKHQEVAKMRLSRKFIERTKRTRTQADIDFINSFTNNLNANAVSEQKEREVKNKKKHAKP